ncbi:MAG: GUN4 domain-containing protein [Xenococcus sp. (in: cyanobacteria)]
MVEAIQETGTETKIIITCRYDFDSDLLEFFYKQGLEPLKKAELTKKLNRLEYFSSDKLSEDIRDRALNLADGNPRLLEFLNSEILARKDAEVKLTELQQNPELWKDQIIHEELYQLIDEPLQQILSYCLVYELWGKQENESGEKWQEIFRLLFADKDNPDRFRQGFSQMLKVQYNEEADKALELELRRLKDELPAENLCCQLEGYLRQGEWRKADEETAWIFYFVMVKQGYKDWYELCQYFPSMTLNEIDQLWVNYSQGNFGFSIQKQICENMEKNSEQDLDSWEEVGKQIGWYGVNDWKIYSSLFFSIKTPKGNLPALFASRAWIHSCGFSLYLPHASESQRGSRAHLCHVIFSRINNLTYGV